MNGKEGENDDHGPKVKREDLERLIEHIERYPDVNTNSMTPIVLRRLKEELQKVKFYEYVADCPGISSNSKTLQTILKCIDENNNAATDFGILGLETMDDHEESNSSNPNKVEVSSFCSSSTEEEDNPNHKRKRIIDESSNNTRSSKVRSTCWSVMKFIWEFWLVLLLLVMVGSLGARDWYNLYWVPWMETVVQWTPKRALKEYTYYDQICGLRDIRSSATLEDIKVTHVDDAVSIQAEYGLSYYSKVLSDDTSRRMREFVLQKNANLSEEEAIWLISQENRWSFYIDVDETTLNDNDPIVSTVLQELADHPILAPSLEAILKGEEAAIVELTAITSAYGAGDQHWHTDTGPSDIHYSQVFSPMYSLFIPLQDTNAEMGPTDVCPGSHVCSDSTTNIDERMFPNLCNRFGMRVSPMEQGDVMLLHLHTWHRGPAHNDPTPGSERVMLIFSVTPKPTHSLQISHGTSYSLRWDQFGYFLSDFQRQNQRQPRHLFWKTLQSIGLINSNYNNNYGWSYLAVTASRIIHDQFGFREDDLNNWLDYVHRHREQKWLLHYVAGFLPNEDEGEWTAYLGYVLDNILSTARNIYIAFFLFATVISVLFQKINHRKYSFKVLLRRPLLHLALSFLLLYPFYLYMEQQVNDLPSLQKQYTLWSNLHPLQPKQLVQSAPTITANNHNNNNNNNDLSSFKTKMPVRESVLVPSRTDSLDFHQGNYELIQQLKEQGHYYNFEPWFQKLVQDRQKEQNNGAFLHQNIETGDWHVLTERQALEYVQWQWMQVHKFQPKTNPATKRIIASRHSQLFTKDLIHHLFQPLSANDFAMKQSNSEWMNRKPQSSLTSIHSTLPRKSQSLKSSSLDSLPSMEEKESLYFIGDFVESFVEGEEGWYRGQISGFEFPPDEPMLIEVMFDDGVFVDDNLVEDVRRFVPYVEGESVWIIWPDEDNDITLGVIKQVRANLLFHIADANDPDRIYEDIHIVDIRRA